MFRDTYSTLLIRSLLVGICIVAPDCFPAQDFAPRLNLLVTVANDANLPAPVLNSALKYAQARYWRGGIRISWMDRAVDRGLTLRFLSTCDGSPISESALGYSRVPAYLAPVGLICLDRIRQFARREVSNFECLLGLTAAHELAHLLGASHSPIGLMQRNWTARDVGVWGQRMYFTPRECNALRLRAAMLAASDFKKRMIVAR